MKADLHVHTTFSDGVWTPLEVAQAAAAQGMDVLAITDHDALGGADALRGQSLALQVIPGVELSLRDMAGLHLLGYGADARAAALRHKLDELSKARVERAAEMCRLLTRLGFPLSLQELPCQGTVGRAHIARAMVERGWVATVQEAFDRFLAEGAPAYVPGQRLSMAEALELLHGCGMVPVLAHPALIPVDSLAFPVLLKHWRDQACRAWRYTIPHRARRGMQYWSNRHAGWGCSLPGAVIFIRPGRTGTVSWGQ